MTVIPIDDMPAFDLHVHTKYSRCSLNDPSKLVKRCLKVGLTGVVITDHNTMKGYEQVRKEAGELQVIPGCEFTTERGEVLGLFIQEMIKFDGVEELVDRIHQQGGLASVPHPFDGMRHSAWPISADESKLVDAVEVWNGRCLSKAYNLTAREFADDNGLAYTAGSDAHFLNEVGKCYVQTDGDLADGIRRKELRIR